MPSIRKLQKHLESYIEENGFMPSAAFSKNPIMVQYGWLRDMYFCSLAVRKKARQKIAMAFQDYFDKIQELGKFNLSQTNWENEWAHIHPLFNKKLEEKKEWSFVQNDSVGDMLEVLAEAEDCKRASVILNYLDGIKCQGKKGYWNCPDYGFWEEGPRQIRSSSLASCIRGIERFEDTFGVTEQTKRMKNEGYKMLYTMLPNETFERKADLALLTLIFPKQIVEDKMKKQILENIKPLIGEMGIKRYFGDKWDGVDWTLGPGIEMQWNLHPLLYLCTNNIKYLEKSREIRKKYGYMPEGFIKGMPNGTHLLDNEAFYILSEMKYKKEHGIMEKIRSYVKKGVF